MARSKPKDRSVGLAMPHQEEHDKMMSEMHDTLYALSDKLRKPFNMAGKFLPKSLQPKQTPEAKAAKDHVKRLHKSFKDASKD